MPEAPRPVPIVYVVDDEKIISQTLTIILNISGFHALGFTDPAEALRSAETVTPSVLITDVVMPKMNGIELGLLFRALYPNCKVLLFSGQAATSDLLEAAKLEGHEFNILAKPVHPNDVLTAMAKL